MNKRNVRPSGRIGLIVVNALLVGALAAVTFGPNAQAQSRARADYTMAAGGAKGSQSSVLYVVDTTNQELIALSFDADQKKMQGIGFRDLRADAARLASSRR